MVVPRVTHAGWGLWARQLEWDPRLLWYSLALVGAILLGALVIVWVDRWRKRPPADRPTANDQLAEFRVLYERGDLSREEFERIRAHLGRQIREAFDLPAPPEPAAPDKPPDASGPPSPGG